MAYGSGQQLGNYRIIRLLGKGGFAEVYLGEHIYLKTPAAIKLLQTKVAGQGDMDSFLKEAQTIARLAHPNIVRVMDFGVDNETPYLVMDYAPNGTLRDLHPRGSIVPLPAIIFYVKQVAEALQYAHDARLVHRDVKPENMLIGQRKEILLSDFGIALAAQSSRYQSTQDVIGTVAYMSPEQIQGRPGRASDQYSLGIVVYEWLSGDRPFQGSFIELCTQHMYATPAPLREKAPTLSPYVEQVVTSALAKDPRQRFPTVQAFAAALEQATQTEASSTFVRPAPQAQFPPIASQTQQAQTILPAAYTKPAVTPPFLPSGPAAYYDSYNNQARPATGSPYSQSPFVAQNATPPFLPSGAPPYYDNYSNQGRPATGSSYSQPPAVKQITGNTQSVNPWSIVQRQIVATLISIGTGLILTIILGLLNQNQAASHNPQNLVITLILFAVLVTIPIFSGAVFGRWVGFLTGGLGSLACYVLLNIYAYDYVLGKPLPHSEPLQFWPVYLGFALVGLISGSAALEKGTGSNIRIGRTLGLSSRGILLGAVFFALGTVLSQPNHSSAIGLMIGTGILAFVSYALTYILANLIILPIPLAIYNSVAGFRGTSR